MKKIKYIILLLFLIACKPSTIENPESTNEILNLYANKNVMDNEFIFYKSMRSINQFKRIVEHPATMESFTQVFDPVIDVQIDTLISIEELNQFNMKLENYYSVKWDQDVSANLPIINKDDIPDFHFEGGIPRKGGEIMTVHYISTPIISNELAIIFFSKITDPHDASSGYYLFLKRNNTWEIVAENNILIIS